MDWTNCVLEVKMEPEKTLTETPPPTSTTETTLGVTEALEGLNLTQLGVGITKLSLNPDPPTNRRRPRTGSESDNNWRDRGDNDSTAGAAADGLGDGGDRNLRPGGGEDNSNSAGDNSNANSSATKLFFKDQRDICNFMTGETFPSPTPLPLTVDVKKLLSLDKIESMNGKYLGIKYEDSKKIFDYKEFHELKQTYFYRWLVDQGYFQNIGKDKKWKKPDFISNEGRIADALLTPLKKPNGWQFFAMKYQDIIFLSSVDVGNRQSSTLESHCGYVYRAMITGGDPESEIINEFEKVLGATEVTFGDHQLLVVSETDAWDADGNLVKTRAYKPITGEAPFWVQRIERSKFLKFWGVSIIPGVKTMVLGHRDKSQFLQATECISTDELWQRAKFGEKAKDRCYIFTNRLLDFIKEQFKGNDDSIVKLFKWEGVPRNKEPREKGGSNGDAGGDNRAAQRPRAPHVDLENASVICTTVVDVAAIERISKFMLPDYFKQAFNNE